MLKLIYIRNYKFIEFTVRDVDHAVALADAIAENDLLNCYNMFDLEYMNGESWESDDGKSFEEYFANL